MATIGRADHEQAAESAIDAQADVARLRRTLLGGRGPGASTSEFLTHTRARLAVGGEPVPALRERVARVTAAARGDADALAVQVAADRARLAGDLHVLLPRLRPRALRDGAERRVRRLAARRRVRVAALLLAAWLVLGRLRRRGR